MPDSQSDPDQYAPEEAARRRDEVVKRMLNTPPKPHSEKSPARQPASKRLAKRDAENER